MSYERRFALAPWRRCVRVCVSAREMLSVARGCHIFQKNSDPYFFKVFSCRDVSLGNTAVWSLTLCALVGGALQVYCNLYGEGARELAACVYHVRLFFDHVFDARREIFRTKGVFKCARCKLIR